ncbi:hypothetical protein F5H01DRAFT_304359 [Linnemannia elongata]|nr:hypothetical protein F5H01DRAFT_304359 [Linnemannia elongata]
MKMAMEQHSKGKMARTITDADSTTTTTQPSATDSPLGQAATASSTSTTTRPPNKQAKVSASARTRPVMALETPVGAFPITGINNASSAASTADRPPPASPVLPHKQANGSTLARSSQQYVSFNSNNNSAASTANAINNNINSNGVTNTNLNNILTTGDQQQQAAPIRYSFAHRATNPPDAATSWKPTMSLDLISPGASPSTLATREMFAIREPLPVFYLEKNYVVRASLPRSFYMIMAQHGIKHCCVFDFPVGSKWWSELSGLRKSTYVDIRAENSSERWELHLKPSRDRINIFGYICKHDYLANVINGQKMNLLHNRRLPLVLDLDDTLVRLIGNERTRYVSEADAMTVPTRIRKLRDGRQVVLTDHVEEFLEWACRFYEISVCSLGEQSYVEQVADVLDPLKTRIRGLKYSARQEYDFLNPIVVPPTPPKDLLSLYAFCAANKPPTDGLPDIGTGFSLPLILDDLTQMWPPDQHDNVIVVKEQRGASVWTVNLFPMVQHVLMAVHSEFFRAYDQWVQARQAAVASITIGGAPPAAGLSGSEAVGGAIDFTATTAAKTAFLNMPVPSPIGCYKEWLRGSLSNQISLTYAAPPAHLVTQVAQQHQQAAAQQQQAQQQQAQQQQAQQQQAQQQAQQQQQGGQQPPQQPQA